MDGLDGRYLCPESMGGQAEDGVEAHNSNLYGESEVKGVPL